MIEIYTSEIRKNVADQLGLLNPMKIPSISHICVNIGLGLKGYQDSKLLDYSLNILSSIVGQKAVTTYAKNSISGFKIRQGMPIGCKVTVRNNFLISNFIRKIFIALARSRDFSGILKKQFDGRGNCTFGIKEHVIFPDVDYDKSYATVGMDISVITTAVDDHSAYILLKSIGFPFVSKNV